MIILIIHMIVCFEQNISFIFYVKDGSHVRLRHPSCVYISAQRQYTAVLKMCTLLKWLSLPYILGQILLIKLIKRNLYKYNSEVCQHIMIDVWSSWKIWKFWTSKWVECKQVGECNSCRYWFLWSCIQFIS